MTLLEAPRAALPSMSHVIPLQLVQTLKLTRWNCNVFRRSQIMTVGNYVRNLSGPGAVAASAPPPAPRSGPPGRHSLQTSGRWGFCAMRSALSACRRRVAPLNGVIPPPRGLVEGPSAKTQTTSAKNAEYELLVAKWSAFWAQRCLSWCVVRTLALDCACKPLDAHVNR